PGRQRRDLRRARRSAPDDEIAEIEEDAQPWMRETGDEIEHRPRRADVADGLVLEQQHAIMPLREIEQRSERPPEIARSEALIGEIAEDAQSPHAEPRRDLKGAAEALRLVNPSGIEAEGVMRLRRPRHTRRQPFEERRAEAADAEAGDVEPARHGIDRRLV